MEKRNKILIIIIAVLVVAIGITCTFIYQNYRMSQMDSYMKESNVLADENVKLNNDTQKLIDQDKDDEALVKLDEAIKTCNQSIDSVQKGYEFADGPYKDLLAIAMKRDKVFLELLQSWKSRILLFKEGKYYDVNELKSQEQDRLNDMNRYNDEYESIKSKNPGMQEHIDKFWQP